MTREERGVGREDQEAGEIAQSKAYSFPRPPLKIARRLSAVAVEAQAFARTVSITIKSTLWHRPKVLEARCRRGSPPRRAIRSWRRL